MDFTYRREGAKDFTETLEAVERLVNCYGFDVIERQDIQALFAAKGFEIQPLVVLDIDMSGSGNEICKVHVYAEENVVWVAAVSPGVFWRVAACGIEGDEAAALENSVVALVDAVCG